MIQLYLSQGQFTSAMVRGRYTVCIYVQVPIGALVDCTSILDEDLNMCIVWMWWCILCHLSMTPRFAEALSRVCGVQGMWCPQFGGLRRSICLGVVVVTWSTVDQWSMGFIEYTTVAVLLWWKIEVWYDSFLVISLNASGLPKAAHLDSPLWLNRFYTEERIQVDLQHVIGLVQNEWIYGGPSGAKIHAHKMKHF